MTIFEIKFSVYKQANNQPTNQADALQRYQSLCSAAGATKNYTYFFYKFSAALLFVTKSWGQFPYTAFPLLSLQKFPDFCSISDIFPRLFSKHKYKSFLPNEFQITRSSTKWRSLNYMLLLSLIFSDDRHFVSNWNQCLQKYVKNHLLLYLLCYSYFIIFC